MAFFEKKKLRIKKEKKVKRHTIMIVDDLEVNLNSMVSLLSDDYYIITACDGEEALDKIHDMENPESIALIISDQRIPILTGLQLFEKIKYILPNTIRIIMTSYDDKSVMLDSINKAEIYGFFLRPWDPDDLISTVKRAIEAFERKRDLDEYRRTLEKKNQELAQKNEKEIKKHSIMIVDDEKAHLESMESLLSEDYNIITALHGKEALDITTSIKNSGNISVVIADQRMPELTGLQLFEKIKDILPNTIRIILTAYDDKDVIIDAINKAQIHRFILKPFEPENLKRTIKDAVEAFVKKKEKFEKFDPLTGLRNRNYFYESILTDIKKVDKDIESWNLDSGKPIPALAFLLINLDKFSSYKNIYSYQVSDSILKQVAGILRGEFPQSDTLFRWGDDEFLVVSRFTGKNKTELLAERIRKSIKTHPLDLENGKTKYLTCSIGFAPYPFIPTQLDFTAFNWEKVLEISHKALHAAKDLGRNTWVGIMGTENTKKDRIEYLSQVERERLLDYIKQLHKKNEIKILSSEPKIKEPIPRLFFSYGQLDNNEHFYAKREKLIDKAYNQLVGNPEKGGHYITVWGPRQVGKSWLMREVLFQLEKDQRFCVIKINLEDQKDKKNVGEIISSVARKIGEELDETFTGIDNIEKFQDIFRKEELKKPLILILDEFDAIPESAINTLVTAFRNIYITRRDQIHRPTEQKKYLLHGLALIGIRSVLGIGHDKGSPFNVQKSLQIPNLLHEEVKGLFQWYKDVSGQEVKPEVIDRLYNETNGQPGITCWFSELLTEGFKHYTNDTSRPIGMKEFEIVFSAAIDTLPNNNIINIISKAKKESNKIKVLQMFQTNEKLRFRFDDPAISELYMNGVVDEEKAEDNRYYLKFSSPFIQKRLFNYFAGEIFTEMGQLMDPFVDLDRVITPKHIYVPELMKLYQDYLEKNKNWLFKDAPRRNDNRLYEAVFHFNLYAYIDHFLRNKNGSVFPEFPTGNGKIDLVINYSDTHYGIELKSFKDQPNHELALKQASRYGKQLNLSEIYLVTFMEYIDEKMRQKYEVDFKDSETNVTVKTIIIKTGNP